MRFSLFLKFSALFLATCSMTGVVGCTPHEIVSTDEIKRPEASSKTPESETPILTSGLSSAPTPSPTSTPTPVEPKNEDLVLIIDHIPDAVIDLKYATTDNFTGQVIYESADCYLRYGTVKKLKVAAERLRAEGYLLKIWDGFRPYAAQCKLWEVCPDPDFVSHPVTGSCNHCRGNAVDLTLVRLDGSEVTMPTGFDDFSKAADRDYSDLPKEIAENALRLENAMYAAGFGGYSKEWWHFNDSDSYEIVK